MASRSSVSTLSTTTQSRHSVHHGASTPSPSLVTACTGKPLESAHTPLPQSGLDTARHFQLPLLDLTAFDNRLFPDQLIDTTLLQQHQVLPLVQRKQRLYLATADPANTQALQDIQFHTGLAIELVVVNSEQLRNAIKAFSEQQDVSRPLLQHWSDTDLQAVHVEMVSPIDIDDAAIDEAPIVRFVNKLLLDAMNANASDIHIEPYERSYRIRFRLDGVLREIARPPIRLAARIAARIKVMSRLDISEKRIPQDGRIKLHAAGKRALDLRVNTLPTLWGEKIVMRLLDPANTRLGIDALGFFQDQKTLFLEAIARSQGLVLVTGPTGSGKSVTLYTGLNILNASERNIVTAEDPVELPIDGLNQVSIKPKAGFDFTAALRAFLRQDPDVIMIGEIRDRETAETAIRAAQTGHLVLSTLHTNSAAETLTRLLNMGIEPFNLVSSISLIIAQRLARRLCRHCKETVHFSEKVLVDQGFSRHEAPALQLFQAVGCNQCKRGYQGRIGIFEVVPITQRLSRSIMNDTSGSDLAEAASAAGFRSLRQSALQLAAQGQISLEEANRLV